MVRDATTKGVISVSNPTIWRPILAIEDAARAYVKAVEAPQRVSGVFNIASFNMTLLAIAVVIAEWFKKHRKTAIKLAIGKDASPRSYRTGIEKAREQLHFEPKVDIAKIVRTIVEHEAGYGDYSNPAFYTIATFRSLRTGPKPSGSMIEIDKLRSC
jgi:nucleoside-diphosphate-sugar epimerase